MSKLLKYTKEMYEWVKIEFVHDLSNLCDSLGTFTLWTLTSVQTPHLSFTRSPGQRVQKHAAGELF